MNEEEPNVSTAQMELADAIKVMAKVLYGREYVEKKEPIYDFYEMRRIIEESEPTLKQFFTQLYLAARPSDRNANNGSYEEANDFYLLSIGFIKQY